MMLRQLESGIVAARTQIAVVLLIGTIALPLTEVGGSRVGSLAETLGDPALLKWIFLAAAAISALGFTRSLSRTAVRLSLETQLVARDRAKGVRIDLLLTLRVATAAMVVLTITPPPKLLLRVLDPLLDPGVTALAWVGAMSVGVAYFGSGASAARRALRG